MGRQYLTREKVLEAGRQLEADGGVPCIGMIAARLGVCYNTVATWVSKLRREGAWPWPSARRGPAITFGPRGDPVPPARRRRLRRRRVDMAAWEASMREWRARAGPYIHG